MTRLRIQPLKISDINHIMTWVNDPDVVRNFQHFTKRFTRADELQFLKKMLASKRDYLFSFFEKDTGIYVGQGGIHQISQENALGRLSLFVHKSCQDKGYGQEALNLLLEQGFRKLKLHKLWLIVWADNKKGIHIYKKTGFKAEGIMRDEYFWRGRYHDMLRMSMLTSEFKYKKAR